MRRRRSRQSAGIACCRIGTDRELEILLVHKRYSYAFVKFIQGQYDPDDCGFLFDQMTVQEKLDIQSMHFEFLWHKVFNEIPVDNQMREPPQHALPISRDEVLDVDRIALIRDPVKQYMMSTAAIGFDDDIENRVHIFNTRKEIFDRNWCSSETRRQELRRLIAQSENARLRWEIPKGGISEGETLIACAVREFEQETQLDRQHYMIVPEQPINDQYHDNGILWKQCYYVAMSRINNTPAVNMTTMQSQEIDEIQWMSMRDVMRLNDPRLESLTRSAFDVITSTCARNKQRPGANAG